MCFSVLFPFSVVDSAFLWPRKSNLEMTSHPAYFSSINKLEKMVEFVTRPLCSFLCTLLCGLVTEVNKQIHLTIKFNKKLPDLFYKFWQNKRLNEIKCWSVTVGLYMSNGLIIKSTTFNCKNVLLKLVSTSFLVWFK